MGRTTLGALGLVFLLVARPTHAGPIDDAKAAYTAGKAAFDTGDSLVALEQFREAYRLVLQISDDDPQKAVILEALLHNTVLAERDAYVLDHDVVHLRKASTSCRNLLNLDKLQAGTVDEYESVCAQVSDDLAAAEGSSGAGEPDEPSEGAAPEPVDSAPVDEPEKEGPETEPSSAVSADPDSAPKADGKRQVVLGAALGGTGVAVLGAGIGLAVYGSTFEASAIESVRNNESLNLPSDWDPSMSTGNATADMEIEDQLDRERGKGKALMVVGGISAGVGAGLLATGIVFLVKGLRARSDASARFRPGVGSIRMTF